MIIQFDTRLVSKNPFLIILDRDDTLISDSGGVKIFRDEFLNSKLISYLSKFKSHFNFSVASNQSYIERGEIEHSDLIKFHEKMTNRLLQSGLSISAIAYCPHIDSQDIKIKCECRKPGSSMLRALISIYEQNIKNTIFIGNRETDRIAAENLEITYFDVNELLRNKDIEIWLGRK